MRRYLLYLSAGILEEPHVAVRHEEGCERDYLAEAKQTFEVKSY